MARTHLGSWALRQPLRKRATCVLGFKEGRIFSEKLNRAREGPRRKCSLVLRCRWWGGCHTPSQLWAGWYPVPQFEKKHLKLQCTDYEPRHLGQWALPTINSMKPHRGNGLSWLLIQWNHSQSVKKFGKNLQNETTALGSEGLSAAGPGGKGGQYSWPHSHRGHCGSWTEACLPSAGGPGQKTFQTLESSPPPSPTLLPGLRWRNTQNQMQRLMRLWKLLTPWQWHPCSRKHSLLLLIILRKPEFLKNR